MASMLRILLVDGGVDANVIIIPTMSYIGIEIERPLFITLKIINERICKLQGMIFNVGITLLGIVTIIAFHVVLEEDVSNSMILD